ncbi:hypothetical protein SAPIO_CDS4651 [Scedosporium apiospermum]|uniref:Uncharacterized protein n=1 Tax=Pseudallescheria apiosperma TaxID=563466 RepID=A0A084G7Z7_PSEDA|nr:uncharacterized protein SAPIO_CDS4651 [Scedosporium apiospermum]KEZ43459.1 hypothetical protein SAPIO_CDS4651 [Scedosporium apiospermum]
MSQLEQQFEGLFSDEDRKALQRAAELLGLSFTELVSQRNPHASRRHDPNAAPGSVVSSTSSSSSDVTTPVDVTTPTQLLWPTLTWSPGFEYPVRSGASLIAPSNGSYIDLPIWPNERLNWQDLLQEHSYAPDVGLDFGTDGFTLEKGLFGGDVNSLSVPNDISLSPWYMAADLGAGASFETTHSRTSTKITPIDDLAIVQSIALAAGGLGYLDAAAELGRVSGHTQPQSSLLPANTLSLLDESDSVDLTSLLTPFPDHPRLTPQCLADPLDPEGDCLVCKNLKGRIIYRLPCLRYKISDTKLLDKGPHPRFSWTQRWKTMEIVEIVDWASDEIRTITLTQDIGDSSYDIQVREFNPVLGDSLDRSWNSASKVHSHPCTPYAIHNMKETADAISKFVDANTETFISHYVDREEELLWNTYWKAYDHIRETRIPEERKLLISVLRLWVAARMESKQERISSAEVLGMTPQDWDPKASNYGKYLVPPVMQAQIELLTTRAVMIPMKDMVLKQLQTLVEKNQVRSWFTVYLAIFILLHSCAMLTRAEAIRSRPFAMDWDRPGNISFAQLNEEQVRFLKRTVELVEKNGTPV